MVSYFTSCVSDDTEKHMRWLEFRVAIKLKFGNLTLVKDLVLNIIKQHVDLFRLQVLLRI
jgi:hypothetical protein